MPSDKDFNKLLEKIYAKLENLNSFEEADLFEIKNKIREISATITSSQVDGSLEKLSNQLNDIEDGNISLKNTISDLITTSSEMIAKLSTTDENSIIKLQTFLTELAYQVASIKDDIELGKNDAQKTLLDGFKNLEKSLKVFQEDLSQKAKNDFEGANLAFSKIIEELTEKITEIEVQFQNYNNSLTKEIISSINAIQTDATKINQHLENITNLQNLALTNAEYEEHQKEFELNQEESLSKIKSELNELHEKLSVEIIEMLSKISSKEEMDSIKTAIDENSDTLNHEMSALRSFIDDFKENSIEQTSFTIQEIKSYLESNKNTDFVDSIEKISTIYENITAINKWVSKIDEISKNVIILNNKIDEEKETSIDFNDLAEKVDIVYENISILNEWASKLDKINKEIDSLNTKIDESNETTEDEEDLANKIDIIYENLSLLNNWIAKIDSISEKVSLYSEISNKVDEVSENVSNISTWGFKIEDIKNKLEELSNEFAIMTSATKDDTENYIYTLLDIESDFAKLHCQMDNNSKTATEELQTLKDQFDTLNEDISSISKRTNKLILTSDDANKIFKNHVDRFQFLIEDLSNKAAAFKPEVQYTLLENKINTIKKITASNLTSNQNLNEAFILLAEWVDSTGEVFSNLKEGIDNIQSQVENVQHQNIEIQNDLELEFIKDTISEITNKFTEQENTISSLETKIDVLEAKLSLFDDKFNKLDDYFNAANTKMSLLSDKFDSLDSKIEGATKTEDTSEVKTVLDFIASQVIAANENSINNKVLNQKMEIMEHQLSKFEKNIAKLVSYLEED